jgi:hypothetical protein
MKRFLSLTLALGLVGVFAGCSNDEKASEDPASNTATKMTEEATNTVLENYGDIEAYVTGKTVAELEELGKYTTDEDKAKIVNVVVGLH